MTTRRWLIPSIIAVAVLAVFGTAWFLDFSYELNLTPALQAASTVALLAVTWIYTQTTRNLVDSQKAHYAELSEEALSTAMRTAFKQLPPFALRIGKVSGAVRRFFANPTENTATKAMNIRAASDDLVDAAHALFQVVPGVGSVWVERLLALGLEAVRTATATARLSDLVSSELARSEREQVPFSVPHIAAAWEESDPDAPEHKYCRWADLSSGSFLEAVADRQQATTTEFAMAIERP